MGNPFKNEDSQMVSRSVKELDAVVFFQHYNLDKKAFLAWGEQARDEDIQHISKFLVNCLAGRRISGTTIQRLDAGNQPYTYVAFFRSRNSSDGCKLLLCHPWNQLLEDYQDGLVKITFTLNELIAEARK